MPAMNVVFLGLSVLATLHLTSGQWGDHSRNWGRGGRWGQEEHGTASRAICTAFRTDPAFDGITRIEITIKRTSNGWWGSRLEMEVTAATGLAADRERWELVLTEFGADDNEGGCTVENLGNIVKRRNRGSSWTWGSGSRNGVIGVVDLTGAGTPARFSDTFRNLPISSLEEAYGCGVAFCEDTEVVDDGNEENWRWGWGGSHWGRSWGSTERKMRCTGAIPICCHLGKSEDDADIGI